jgi:WD40 repeat protein
LFERDLAIWSVDVASGKAAEVPITLRGVSATVAAEHQTLTQGFGWLALSPDGKKIAFTAHGEVFAASARDGGDAARITNTPELEAELAWAPDSRRLAYVSSRDGPTHVYVYDFVSSRRDQADGRSAQRRDADVVAGRQDDRLRARRKGAARRRRRDAPGSYARHGRARPAAISARALHDVVARRPVDRVPVRRSWSIPESICRFAQRRRRSAASYLSNMFGGTVAWSPDGTYLLFDTSQRTEEAQIARVDLVPRTPRFREDQFRDLFQQQPTRPGTPTEPAPRQGPPQRDTATARADSARAATRGATTLVFDDIRRRLSFLPVGVDARSVTISPDGKTALLIASAAGQANLYTYSLDELSTQPIVARQLTSTPGGKSNAQFTADSKEVYYLENGRINVVSLDTRTPRPINVSAGTGRRFRAGEARAVPPGLGHSRRQLLRREDERRGLARRRRPIRALRRGGANHRRAAPHHETDDRRAERVALRRERPELLAANQRRDASGCGSTAVSTSARGSCVLPRRSR